MNFKDDNATPRDRIDRPLLDRIMRESDIENARLNRLSPSENSSPTERPLSSPIPALRRFGVSSAVSPTRDSDSMQNPMDQTPGWNNPSGMEIFADTDKEPASDMEESDEKRIRLMKQIQSYGHAVSQALLYLDMHPEDTAALAYYDKYRTLLREALRAYESDYRNRIQPMPAKPENYDLY